MKVRLFADFKESLDGCSEVYIKLNRTVTLEELIDMLIEGFDGEFRYKILQSADKLGENMMILVNKKLVKSLDAEIRDEDEVAFLPPASGG